MARVICCSLNFFGRSSRTSGFYLASSFHSLRVVFSGRWNTDRERMDKLLLSQVLENEEQCPENGSFLDTAILV